MKRPIFEPMNDFLIAREITDEEKTAAGIILIKTQRNDPVLDGEIIAVCEGSKFQVGEQVMFAAYAGKLIIVGEEKFLSIPESAVMTKVTWEETVS